MQEEVRELTERSRLLQQLINSETQSLQQDIQELYTQSDTDRDTEDRSSSSSTSIHNGSTVSLAWDNSVNLQQTREDNSLPLPLTRVRS